MGKKKAQFRAGMFWTRVGMHGVRLPNTFQNQMDKAKLKKKSQNKKQKKDLSKVSVDSKSPLIKLRIGKH